MNLTFLEKIHLVGDVWTYYFDAANVSKWQAGQYMKYFLSHPNPDERGIKRYFTISSAPHEQKIAITTHKGRSSFKQALEALQSGDTIEAEGPRGDFVLGNPSDSYLFLAGGVGITPFRSIIADMDYREQPITITLLYANRDQNVVFKEELDAIAARNSTFHIHYLYSPKRITESSIKECASDLTKSIFYASGPEPFVLAMADMLKGIGVPEEHLKQDDFPGYDWPEQSE